VSYLPSVVKMEPKFFIVEGSVIVRSFRKIYC